MLEKFLESFHISQNGEKNIDKELYKNLHKNLYSLIESFGGASFNEGLYRVHTFSGSIQWSVKIAELFEEYKNKIYPFGFDWLGRQYCLSLSSEKEILIFDPETVEVFLLEQDILLLHDVKPLSNYALLQYVENRAISLEIARKYCEEVSYTNAGKSFYAIGFKNDLSGYELRSKYFKGSNSPKGITHEKRDYPTLTVFEGFFNFLSFQTHFKNHTFLKSDFLVLNSLSFFDKARPIMESYRQVNLYLDNNIAGQRFTAEACKENPIYQNKNGLFAGFEDMNDSHCDFIRQQPKEIIITPKRSKGFRP